MGGRGRAEREEAEPLAMASFALFAWLWALSGLLDIAPYDAWLRSPFHALFAAVCALVLVRPRWLPAFAAMHALRVASFAWDSPDTANHQLLYAIASATVLCSFPLAARREGRALEEAWFERFAPVLRVELLMLYFFGVLHKLNRDYFDPEVSCGVQIFLDVAPSWLDGLVGSGEVRRHALIYGSLLAEASVPLLLCFGRTRRAGIALGALFHGFLGLRFYAFSTGLLALYSLFVPPAFWREAGGWLSEQRVRGGALARLPGARTAGALALVLVAGFGVAAAAARAGPEWSPVSRAAFPLLAAGWIALVAVPLATLLGSRRLAPAMRGRPAGRLAPPWLLVFPLLVLFHGFAPYLGLRTVPAFSMFSNLRTEGGLTNHWFMPSRALRVADFQEDLVVVLSSNDEDMLRFARRPRRTYYDFRRHVQRLAGLGRHDVAVRFRRGGEVVERARAETDPELMAPVPWWQRKWLKFRPVSIAAKRECSW
jgi:hypothetical protein